MTIWSGQTQRSIASGFVAASVSGKPHTAQRGAERAARTAQRDGAHGSRRALPLKAPSGNHALRAISRNSA